MNIVEQIKNQLEADRDIARVTIGDKTFIVFRGDNDTACLEVYDQSEDQTVWQDVVFLKDLEVKIGAAVAAVEI